MVWDKLQVDHVATTTELPCITCSCVVQREKHNHIPVFLLHQVLEYGWCDHVTTLIYWHQPAHVEKGLLAMEAMKNTCDFTGHNSQLHALVKQFRKAHQDEGDEFITSLLDQCTELLKSIRQANRDL